MRILTASIAVFLILASSFSVSARQAVKYQRLSIDGEKGAQVFFVEVVRSEKERNRGLMFRKEMAVGHGMLFDYYPAQVVAFWMKNTFLPLDIIFIGPDGRIIRIEENAVPHSLRHIPSGGDTRGVLEINGGLSARLGIKPGNLVHHGLFEPAH